MNRNTMWGKCNFEELESLLAEIGEKRFFRLTYELANGERVQGIHKIGKVFNGKAVILPSGKDPHEINLKQIVAIFYDGRQRIVRGKEIKSKKYDKIKSRVASND